MDKKTAKALELILDKKFDQKLEPIHKKLDEHSTKLDSLMLDMFDVQKKTDVLPDLHSMIKDTKEKVDELEERVDRLETAA